MTASEEKPQQEVSQKAEDLPNSSLELKEVQAGQVTFLYHPLTTELYVDQIGEEWEVEIYKYKHYQGSLEIDQSGKILIVEDVSLSLKEIEKNRIEVI